MSATQEEAPITHRVSEHPETQFEKLRNLRGRALGYRFAAGAVTSVVAGVLTLAFGSRIGGVMLAFPAILAASLTLIEDQEDSAEAREDARGAVAGGAALAVFAAIAATLFGRVNAALTLALATLAWFATVLLLYLVAWFK
jgi:small-conductance mechanosensitive channel